MEGAANKHAELKVSARTPQAHPRTLAGVVTVATGVRSVVRNLGFGTQPNSMRLY